MNVPPGVATVSKKIECLDSCWHDIEMTNDHFVIIDCFIALLVSGMDNGYVGIC
jgi:hypothetical protein